ncbi:hypothetical protein P8605_15960, partial [Streptomyces sp. T-3]|nr:hypothetical protein [Streptomyces sp. T-3]
PPPPACQEPPLNRRITPAMTLAAGLALAAVGTTASCQNTLGASAERTVYEDAPGKTAGPLSANVAGGAFAMLAPKRAPWHATFGGYLLCTKTGKPATIEKVRPIVYKGLEPLELDVTNVTGHSSPMYSAFGKPPYFPDHPAYPKPSDGTYKPFKPGLEINQRCARGTLYDNQLLVTMKVPKRGAYLERLEIDYTSEGKAYTMKVAWRMTACGTGTRYGDYPDASQTQCTEYRS